MNGKDVKRIVEKELADTKKQLERLEQAAAAVKENAFDYKVILESLWDGETTVEATDKDLNTAIRTAQDRFKLLNHRSDVQAREVILAVFSGGYTITLTSGIHRYDS